MVCEGIRRLRARGCKHLVRAAQIVAEIDAADRLRHKGALTKSLERLEAIYETHVEKDAALLHTREMSMARDPVGAASRDTVIMTIYLS